MNGRVTTECLAAVLAIVIGSVYFFFGFFYMDSVLPFPKWVAIACTVGMLATGLVCVFATRCFPWVTLTLVAVAGVMNADLRPTTPALVISAAQPAIALGMGGLAASLILGLTRR
jgi:hypothetical protein